MGSMVLPHLQNAWQVDQAILSEDERLVVVRFGRDSHPDWYVLLLTNALSSRHFTFMPFLFSVLLTYEIFSLRQDDVLSKIADRVKNFAVVYLCDIEQTPDFNAMYFPSSMSIGNKH